MHIVDAFGGKHTGQLETVFLFVLNEFLSSSAIARAARSQIHNAVSSSEARLDSLRDDRPIPPRPSPDLGYRIIKSAGQIHLSQFISTAVFLLSNQLHDVQDGDQGLELLCSLLDRDVSLATILLRKGVPSVRAAWESLFNFAIIKRRRDTFRILTDVGFHNDWIHTWLHSNDLGDCLLSAIEMDCYDAVAKIVAECHSSSSRQWRWDIGEGILAACKKGNVECARQLIQHCDVNSNDVNSRGLGSTKYWSLFQFIIAKMESNNDEHALALELFLANGADVDKETSREMIMYPWSKLVGQDGLLAPTEPTILDEVFYLNRSLFDKLRQYSRVPISGVTRTGLLVALEHGSQTLRDYLSARQSVLISSNQQYLQSLLGLLLAEQFTLSKRVDMRVLRSLCEFGVDFKMPSGRVDVQNFWTLEHDHKPSFSDTYSGPSAKNLDFEWNGIANLNDRIQLLSMLLTKGGIIGELVLEGWVAKHRTDGLECLASHLPDFPTKAVRALARAARLNDFQAVEFLLRKGVDPNAFVTAFGLRYSIPAIAILASLYPTVDVFPERGCSLEMIQFLVRHGTRLVVTEEDSMPHAFAKHLIQHSNVSDLFAKTKYIVSTLMKDNASPRLPSCLLEMCFAVRKYECRGEELKTFEYLFRLGTEVSPGSPLAALVYHNGPDELVRDVLRSGSDLNAYWAWNSVQEYTPLQAAAKKGNESLVRLFLQEGANVNSPARSRYGVTALQGICSWHPATEEEHQSKLRICRLLINEGADVNYPPAAYMHRALSCSAWMGDLEVAALLLSEGANINATDSNGTALDKAAWQGRLDMVKFLLNANALSSVRGTTGYGGAIQRAEEDGNLAVADLIREHAAKVEAGTIFNPELMKAQEECRFCETGADDESPDENT